MKKLFFTNLFLFVAILLLPFTVLAQTTRVKILATGGTIAGVSESVDKTNYTAGKLPIDQLLAAVPQINTLAKVDGEQLSSIGSQDMSIEIWLKLAKRINEIFEKNQADAVVITHGTDTQEETAYFLNLSVKYNKPIVMVGAMRSATALSPDGPKNLLNAVVVAADPQSQGRGVLVVMNDIILDAHGVSKMSTTAVEAFNSPNFGPIGSIFNNKVEYYYNSIRKKGDTSPFDLKKLTPGKDQLPRVDIIYMYANASTDLIKASIAGGAKGIVIAGVGNGNMSQAYTDVVKEAISKGIVVVRSSRVPTGRVNLDNEVDDKALGTVVSDDLNPQKSRILLMLALQQGIKERSKVQELFFTY